MARLLEGPGIWILGLIVLVLFGSKRLPDAARGVGRSLRIFKAETKGLMTDESGAPPATAAPTPPAPPQAIAAPAPDVTQQAVPSPEKTEN